MSLVWVWLKKSDINTSTTSPRFRINKIPNSPATGNKVAIDKLIIDTSSWQAYYWKLHPKY